MSNTDNKNTTPKSNRKFWIAGGVAGAILASAIGAQAFTSSKTYQHLSLESGNMQSISWRRGNHRAMTPEQMNDRVERMVKHLAIEIDANDEQQKQLAGLAKTLIGDVMPMRGTMRETGEQLQKILTAPIVDRAALEALRIERLAEADKISKKLVNAVADAAEVLTPEQRKTLAERVETFRSMRGRWHKG